jgi:hypothetical protein
MRATDYRRLGKAIHANVERLDLEMMLSRASFGLIAALEFGRFEGSHGHSGHRRNLWSSIARSLS